MCFSQTVLRIWDCLFYEGSKILFRVALTLIGHHHNLISQAQSLPEICERFKQITHGEYVEDCHTFMQVHSVDAIYSQTTNDHFALNDVYLSSNFRKSLWSQEVFPRKQSLNSGRYVEIALLLPKTLLHNKW